MSNLLKCPYCSNANVIKKGWKKDKQRYKCNDCGRRTVVPVGLKVEEKKIQLKNKFEFTQEGNSAELDIKTSQIKTLDALVSHCNIDLKIWKIEKHIINKWDSTFNGNPIPLFQVKVFLSKIIPDEVKIPESS